MERIRKLHLGKAQNVKFLFHASWKVTVLGNLKGRKRFTERKWLKYVLEIQIRDFIFSFLHKTKRFDVLE